MTRHRGDTREIASSQNIKAVRRDGSQLLDKINGTTKINSQRVCVSVCVNTNLWTLKNYKIPP